MPKEKEAPRRMGRDAAGNMVPQRQVRAFWVEEPLHEGVSASAAKNHRSVVEEVRQTLRDRYNGGKAG